MSQDQHDADTKQLHSLGYAQELSRGMSGFSNFAISFSIICILAGGITSFAAGFSSVGGGAIGVGWIVGGAFALLVSLAMGQIASSYPTAGGLYHWGSILGGKAWGWYTAWFNLLGLVFVTASVDAGVFQLFRDLVVNGVFQVNVDAWGSGTGIWIGGTAVILFVHALLNHFGIKITTLLTDFSGYFILVVAVALTASLLIFSPVPLDFSRLVTFTNYTGDLGGGVWPQNGSPFLAGVLGLLLVIYTITGYDASAHTSEETKDAAANAPKGMWRSVAISVVFGYIMVSTFVLVMPDLNVAASKGWGVFSYVVDSSKMPGFLKGALYFGIVIANFLCGLACITSASRMMFAFARDGGLPFSKLLKKVNPKYRTPTIAIWVSAALALASCLYGGAFAVLAAGCAVFLYISYVMPVAAGLWAEGRTWTKKGPFHLGVFSKPVAVLAILGALVLIWVGFQPPNQLVGYLIVGLLVVLTVFWFASEKKRFQGPPVGEAIADRQAEIAKAEETLVG
jgi:amino acid transporter